MNENNEKPAAVYLSPLKGELSQLEGISGMELEGIVENIKATIQSEKNKNKGTSQITGDKSKLSRFFKPFEIFKKTPAKNQQAKNTQPGQEGIDDKKTIEGQMSIFGKKSVLFKLLGGKMEKAIDEEEYDISTKTKNSSKKHKKAKKKAFTTKVREKLVNDLFNSFEAQGKITFSMEEKVTAMAATKDSKYLLIASHSVENIVKQEKSLPTHNLESGTTMNDTNVENLRKNSSIPTVPGATEQVKQPCSLWLVNLETNEKEKLLLEGNLKPENEILSLIVTSDGKYVISGWNDGSIQVYDLNKKKKEYTLHGAHQHWVTCLAITSDDHYIISGGSKDKCLKIFNFLNRSQVAVIENVHQDWVKCVTVTKNNRYIISGSYDATIRVFSFETLALLQTFDVSKPNNVQGYHAENKNFVLCLASTRDCRYVIAGLKDKSLRIFDLEKIESPFIFEASHENWVTSLAITSDDRYVITGSYEGSIRIFDLQKKEKIHTFDSVHKGLISAVVVSEDKRYIASGSSDSFVYLYEMEKSSLVGTIENAHTRGVDALIISQDQKYIVSGSYDGQLRLFNTETLQPAFTFTSSEGTHIKSVAITSDNRWVISGTDDSSIMIFDTQNPQSSPDIFENVFEMYVNALSVTRDDQYLIAAGRKDIRVFDLKLREPIHQYENAHEDDIYCLKTTWNAEFIVTGSKDKSIRIFTLRGADGGLIHVFERAHNGPIYCLDVTKDNKYIVSGSSDRSIKIFDFEKKELVHTFAGIHNDDVLTITLTCDAKYIISGSQDSSIRFFDLENRRPLYSIEKAHDKQVTSIAVSPDSRLIISCSEDYNDNSIKVFSNPYTQSGSIISEFNYVSPFSYYGLFILKTFVQENDQTKKMKLLSKYPDIVVYPSSLNLFHLMTILAPTLSMIKYCVDNRIPFTGDAEGRTPLHYMLNAQQINYTNINFILENFYRIKDSSEYYKLMSDLTKDIPRILNFSPELVLNVLKLAIATPQTYKNEEVTRFGSIANKDSRRIVPHKSTIFTSVIKRSLLDDEGNDLLSTKVLLFNMNYDIHSEEVMKFLQALKDINNEEIFQSKAISVLIDYLWDRSKYFHYGLGIIYTCLLVILSIYSTQHEGERSQALEIILLVLGFFFIGYEALQLIFAGLAVYFAEIWNLVDLLGDACLITSVFLSWYDVDPIKRSWIVSITLFMVYAKWISFFRIIEQARKLIRIIIEVIKDIRSFLAILAFIIMGSSLIFFQFDDDSTSYGDRLLFVYGLIYASFDTTGFSISQIIYLVVVTVMLSVVLLNLLIAIMTETYESLEVTDDLNDGLERVYMILETVVMTRAFRDLTFCCRRRKKDKMKLRENDFKSYLFFVEKVASRTEKEEKESQWEGKANVMKKMISSEMQKHYEPLHSRLNDLATELNKQEDRLCIFERDVEQQVDHLDKQTLQILDLLSKSNLKNLTFNLLNAPLIKMTEALAPSDAMNNQ